MTARAAHRAQAAVEQASADTVVLKLSGDWTIGQRVPSVEEVVRAMTALNGVRRIVFDATGLDGWDSQLLVFLTDLKAWLADRPVQVDAGGLPEGAVNILAIAAAAPETTEGDGELPRKSFLENVGEDTLAFFRTVSELLAFIGGAALSLFRLLAGKAGFRRVDFIALLRECGADALPIVSMISFLVGLILAFVGAIQLMMFGAQLYVADLVGIAMVRVLGAVMTGIIMTGRTGAAFAAQLGTMQANEEIDALETLGISAMDYLVLPRLLGLTLMMPLLCLYADLMAILGGMTVGVTLLDLSLIEYYQQTKNAVGLTHLLIGLFHGLVFGVLVSLSGCLRGIQCGRSASAVGQATTSAVVTGIVSIVVATALITLLCNIIGI